MSARAAAVWAGTNLDDFRRAVRPATPALDWSEADRLCALGEELGEDASTAARWASPHSLAGRRRPDDPDVRRAVERVADALDLPLAEVYETPTPGPADVPCAYCGVLPYARCVLVKGPDAGAPAPFHACRRDAVADTARAAGR